MKKKEKQLAEENTQPQIAKKLRLETRECGVLEVSPPSFIAMRPDKRSKIQNNNIATTDIASSDEETVDDVIHLLHANVFIRGSQKQSSCNKRVLY